jgi:hypothetical protein
MKIDGGCHCGYITYEVEADPQKPFICHCTDCQELSGSAFRIGIRVASDDFILCCSRRAQQDPARRRNAELGSSPSHQVL